MGLSDMDLSVTKALVSERAATASRKSKIDKYDNISNLNSLEFQPLGFETTGRIEHHTLQFFHKIITHMTKDNEMLRSIYSAYWIGRISFCLQKHMALAIINRTTSINADMSVESNYDLSDRFVIDNHFMH